MAPSPCKNCGKTEDLNPEWSLCYECSMIENEKQLALQNNEEEIRNERCLCDQGQKKGKIQICCEECKRWWHPSCVGLNGLSKYNTEKLIDWKCPLCFNMSSYILNQVNSEMYRNVTPEVDLKQIVKKEMSEIVPEIIKEVVSSVKRVLEESNVKEAVIQSNSWADVVKGNQRQLITEVVKQTTEEAHKSAIKLVDANLTEQRKRNHNIVISGMKETENEEIKETVFKVISPISNIVKNDIMIAKRLGKNSPEKDRSILVTLRYEEDANYLHNYKYGRKVEDEQNAWINGDLTRTERELAYNKREEKRHKRVNTGNQTVNVDDNVANNTIESNLN